MQWLRGTHKGGEVGTSSSPPSRFASGRSEEGQAGGWAQGTAAKGGGQWWQGASEPAASGKRQGQSTAKACPAVLGRGAGKIGQFWGVVAYGQISSARQDCQEGVGVWHSAV